MVARSLVLLLLIATAAAAQSRSDVIKGRVTTDSGKVVVDAEVIVTMAPTRVVVRGTGDSTGNYELKIPNGTGEYLVYITALGRTPFRKRITAAGGDSTFVVDAKLAAVPVATLAAVRTVASRPRPPRTLGADDRTGVTGTDRSLDGVNGQLSPDLVANLDAMAATLPGFTMTPDGISAFGMTGANMTTLNGMAMGITDLPRDARVNTRVQTSPWDPATGGFAAARIAASVPSGTGISQRRSHLTLDAPDLQLSQPGAASLGQKYYLGDVGFGADGPIVPQEYFYSYAASLRRTITPVASLLDLNAAALAPNGVAVDSARQLLQTLQGLQIPVNRSGIPTDRTTTQGSFIARFDRTSQPATTPGGLSSAPWWILATGNLRQNDALSLSPASIPAFGSTQRTGSVGLTGFYSTYAGPSRLWLSETQVALAANTNRGDPYITLPSGNVLVTSALDDGTQSVRTLVFGGNSATYLRNDAWSAEVANGTTFFPGTYTTKPIRIFFQGRYDGFDQVVSASRLGSFSFASLGDLASNTPSGFSRTLNVPDRHGGEFTGAAAVGLNWTIKTVNLVGGLRADANAYTDAPAFNPRVDSVFGLSTSHVPNTVALEPRLGFTWTYKPSGMSYTVGPLATSYRGATTIRGGVGRFRSLLAPTQIADALTSTGLPGGMQRLSCIGPATPVPDWQAYRVDTASVPDACVGGASNFVDASPNVIAFDPHYGPQDSWHGTLGSTRTFRNITYVSVDATYAINLGQQSNYDVNFGGAQLMTLPDEANRPVFVSASSIVPATGAVSPVEARVSPSFGRVIDRRSDLRSDAKTVVIHSIPNVRWFDPFITLDYAYSDVRAELRGFDGTTAADPRVPQWARESYTSRHRFILGTGKTLGRFSLTAFTNVLSGVPFTPMVAGDINGDGSSNDRAFVFSPAPPPGAPVPSSLSPIQTAMQTLLATAPARVRDCLTAQINTIAGPNSCSGPWTATMNARLGYFGTIPRIGRRATLSLNLANPLGGIDMLLHGTDGLHGWGSQAFPDQTLLYVRGFNPATRQFTYEVNPRFGATSPKTTAILNPFRVTVDMQFDIGRDRNVQQVEINLRPPRGEKSARASADTIKSRFLRGSSGNGPQDIYRYILSLKDSLALSADQITKLDAARGVFRAHIDSTYTDLAVYLVALPPTFDGGAASKRISDLSDSTWVYMAAQGKPVQAILSPAQIQLLWAPVIATLTKPFNHGYWATGGAEWFDRP